eukprot:CAMPEP_0116967062 /NCGR_PEP_ID=MMETSP0467-20121206/50298_1 /TAXON_ID=283647 /ORGANISM="Mesodinium pulex, Strain SPMC105" /LENGTH=38 /DNA_ID= /DNA_START= /DNA_END= /DNA_ORIENTATION=
MTDLNREELDHHSVKGKMEINKLLIKEAMSCLNMFIPK